jgi:hypothetical protein
MTEKERFAHHVRAEFPGQAEVILAKMAAWDAEIAFRRRKDFSPCSLLTSSTPESGTRQTTFDFGPRVHWPRK